MKYKTKDGTWHEVSGIKGTSAYESAQIGGWSDTEENFYKKLAKIATTDDTTQLSEDISEQQTLTDTWLVDASTEETLTPALTKDGGLIRASGVANDSVSYGIYHKYSVTAGNTYKVTAQSGGSSSYPRWILTNDSGTVIATADYTSTHTSVENESVTIASGGTILWTNGNNGSSSTSTACTPSVTGTVTTQSQLKQYVATENATLETKILEEIPTANGIELVTPKYVYCVADNKVNFCMDNVILYGEFDNVDRAYLFGQTGMKEDGEYVFDAPSSSTIKSCNLLDGSNRIITKNVYFTPTAKDGSSATVNVMCIGDSTTDSGKATRSELTTLFADGTDTINFVGTRTDSASYKHEGRSSWSAKNYCSDASLNSVTNAFWNSTTGTFDFSYYCEQNPTEIPDVVIINLGINDLTAKEDNADIIGYIQTMITSIKAYSSAIKIIVSTPNLCTSFKNTNGYGNNYVGRKNVMLSYIKDFLAYFEKLAKTDTNIIVCPAYVFVNSKWDMQYEEVAQNQYTSYKYYSATDMTHPSDVGYKKIALAYYGALRYALSL